MELQSTGTTITTTLHDIFLQYKEAVIKKVFTDIWSYDSIRTKHVLLL
jgi:hypothetical protein